eukprot:m.165137 g.165137  ORF g.165137 m.165137 type:complete len:426 (+) comp18125_c0_seq2:293-1570(+)
MRQPSSYRQLGDHGLPPTEFYEQLRYALGLEQGQVENEHGDIIDALAVMAETETDEDGFEVVMAPISGPDGSDGASDGSVTVVGSDVDTQEESDVDDDIVIVTSVTESPRSRVSNVDNTSHTDNSLQNTTPDGGDTGRRNAGSTIHSSVSDESVAEPNTPTRTSPRPAPSVGVNTVASVTRRGDARQHRSLLRSTVPSTRMTTPVGGATRSRDDSMQRIKAGRAARGSRRERRWENRQRLRPTAEDLAMDAQHPLGTSIGSSGGLFSFCFTAAAQSALAGWQDTEDDAHGASNTAVLSAEYQSVHATSDGPVGPNDTTAQRLRRIDRATRQSLLRCKKFPYGVLQEMEDMLLGAFARDPRETCVINEPNSFNRCMLHATCKYLGLDSKSETAPDDTRITTITNRFAPAFHPPPVRLSEHLMVSSR